MSRHNNAKRDINLVGRDLTRTLNFMLNIKVLNGLAKLPLFNKPIKFFFGKDILIKELQLTLQEKESEIKRLKKSHSRQIDNLRYEYEKKEKELNVVITSVQAVVKQEYEGTLNPAYLKIQEALNMMTSPDYRKSRKIHINVASFLQENKNLWIEEAIKEAQLRHSNLLNSESEKSRFSINLHGYFNYLNEILIKGVDLDINTFVDSQSISSQFIYRTAFQCIKEKVQDQILNIDEVDLLRRAIEHLVEKNF